LAWLTDIHLNFLEAEPRRRFLESLPAQCDALVVSGDIGESHSIVWLLVEMERIVQRPIYFVLGNHDFYHGSIAETRAEVASVCAQSPYLRYLTELDVVELSPTTALIGHDGWADARCGDFAGTKVVLNDFVLIRELRTLHYFTWLDKYQLRPLLHALGDEAAVHIRTTLQRAVARYPRVIAATHIPPFPEAAWHEGRMSNPDWLPFFSCRAVGEAMREVMQAQPQSQLLVLCGHTHGGGEVQIADNLRVVTGAARYGEPEIQRIWDCTDKDWHSSLLLGAARPPRAAN
jgi:Icc-related predicted phosphoesterase